MSDRSDRMSPEMRRELAELHERLERAVRETPYPLPSRDHWPDAPPEPTCGPSLARRIARFLPYGGNPSRDLFVIVALDDCDRWGPRLHRWSCEPARPVPWLYRTPFGDYFRPFHLGEEARIPYFTGSDADRFVAVSEDEAQRIIARPGMIELSRPGGPTDPAAAAPGDTGPADGPVSPARPGPAPSVPSPAPADAESDGERAEGRLKEPPQRAFDAYRVVKFAGMKQEDVARKMAVSQATISRDVNRVAEWIEAGNILPDLNAPRPKTVAMDPRKLDQGPRLDGRPTRQRSKGDRLSDDDERCP